MVLRIRTILLILSQPRAVDFLNLLQRRNVNPLWIRLSWSFEEVDAKLKGIMVKICHNMVDAAKRYGMEGNYVAGANIAGFEKVVDAMTAQGIV